MVQIRRSERFCFRMWSANMLDMLSGEALSPRVTSPKKPGLRYRTFLQFAPLKVVLRWRSYSLCGGLTYTNLRCRHTIPAINGSLEPEAVVYNYVWYRQYPENSDEFSEIITDNENKFRRFTLPLERIREDVWTQQKEDAKKFLAPSIAELVLKTKQPFIQSTTDLSRTKHFCSAKRSPACWRRHCYTETDEWVGNESAC